MKNEPSEIFLICHAEDETDKLYLPVDNDFETLEPEFVNWADSDQKGCVTIKYINASVFNLLQSDYALLKQENNRLSEENVKLKGESDLKVKQAVRITLDCFDKTPMNLSIAVVEQKTILSLEKEIFKQLKIKS